VPLPTPERMGPDVILGKILDLDDETRAGLLPRFKE
jgi:hypothetical protein